MEGEVSAVKLTVLIAQRIFTFSRKWK